MPTMTLKTKQELEDFVRGVTFLGTGGGGRPEAGLSYLLAAFAAGKEIGWTDVSEIPDEGWSCTSFFMGSIAPRKPRAVGEPAPLGLETKIVDQPLAEAVKELEVFCGVKISTVVPFELGGVNTPGPVDAAARLGVYLVDGDYSGRAVPEAAQLTPALHGKEYAPVVACDEWGNTVVIKRAANNDTAEALGKMVSTVTKTPDAYALCGQAGFLLPNREMKQLIVPGTLSEALRLGRAIREARESGADPAAAAAATIGGRVLFKGDVTDKEWENRDGYMFGLTTVTGKEEYAGHEGKVWFKNENHIMWKDGVAFVTSPDLICIVRLEDAEPITNTNIKAGDAVAIVGKPNKLFRTAKGLELLGPRHFGFDIDYRPLEEVAGV